MNEVLFLTHQMGLQGSYLNHLDLQQYLRDHEQCKIKFYCENVKKLFQIIKSSRRTYTFNKGEVKLLKKDIVEHEKVVITDFKTFLSMKQLGIWVICKKFIIMDSIELTYHLKDMKYARFFHEVDLNKALKQIYSVEDVLFLMPPSNYKIFKQKYPHLRAEIFFKNINVDMIKTLKCKNKPGYFYRWDDDASDYRKMITEKFGIYGNYFEPEWIIKNEKKIPLSYNEVDHIFDYESLVYRRRKYLEYEEQFGRLIFEYILLGKTVYFAAQTHTDDCLTDYLNHYQIRFDGNKVITTKEDLRDKMQFYTEKHWEI
jgi:hypothetical protein